MSVFGIFLVRILPHSDWIRIDTPYPSVFSTNAGKDGPENSKYGHFLRSEFQIMMRLNQTKTGHAEKGFKSFAGYLNDDDIKSLTIVISKMSWYVGTFDKVKLTCFCITENGFLQKWLPLEKH